MTHKEKLSQLAKKIFQSNRGVRNPQLMHPNREWMIGLVLGVSLFAASAMWSLFMYREHRNISAENTAIGEEIILYRESMVDAALDHFKKQSGLHEQYLSATKDDNRDTEVVELEVLEVEPEVDPVLEAETSEENEGVLEREVTSEESIRATTTPEVLRSE